MDSAIPEAALARRPAHPGTGRHGGRLSVLHVTAPAPFGGLERVVRALAGGVTAAGHEAQVAALLTEAGAHPFVDELAGAGVRVHRIVTGARAYLRQAAALRELLERLRPDVVHTHGYQADVLASRVARQLGIPVVATVHGFTGGGWKNRLYEWAQCRAFRRFERVVAVSRPMVPRLMAAGVAGERIACVPNAWAGGGEPLPRTGARAALGVHPQVFHIGWVGRLSREKGADVLVEALGRLRDLPVVASVIGAGPEQAALQRRAGELGVDGRIVWHGAQPDAWRLYPGFDLFVLSSRTEGTPIVLFEAAAAGVPIVAARVGGVPDVVNEAAALLVPPEDPAALAAAIRAAHSEPVAAAARAAAARERLGAEFGVEPWLERYIELYLSLKA